MKAAAPLTEIKYWKKDSFFNAGLASYKLAHHCFPRHFHEHYVIELVVKGADQFYCDGKTHMANPHQIVFINPGEVHTGSTVSDSELHYYSISPSGASLQQIAASAGKSLHNDFCFQQALTDQPLLVHKMLALFRALESSDTETLYYEELFFDFMDAAMAGASFMQDNAAIKYKKDIRISMLIDFIRGSFKESVSLQQMAEQVNISPVHLVRLFKAATGLSPYEYLLVLRMEHAKQLLQKGHSVQDAAWESGFYDASHFNRLFRKISGATPKVFRSSK